MSVLVEPLMCSQTPMPMGTRAKTVGERETSNTFVPPHLDHSQPWFQDCSRGS
jgi:hypothetical protein